MLGLFKKIFTKEPGEPEASPSSPPTGHVAPPQPPAARPVAAPPPAPASPPPAGELVNLPLKGVLNRLPPDLKGSVKQQPRGDATVRVALKTILDQLPRGVVRITFGELKVAAPPGVFSETRDHDQAIVELPLSDILSRLKPSQLPRRPDQKRVEVPAEIREIFGPDGKPMLPPAEPEAAPPIPARPPAVAEPPKPVASPAPAPVPKPAPAPASSPAPAIPVTPPPPKPVESAPIKPIAPLPELPRKPSPAPAPAAKIPLPQTPATLAPAVAAKPEPPPAAAETGVLSVPLESVRAGWPGPVRQEIEQQKLAGANIELPLSEVAAGLKAGKLVFTWLRVRGWLRPPVALASNSANDGVSLDFPLPLIIPLFLAHRKPPTAQRKIVIGENIPDLFRGEQVTPVPGAGAPAASASTQAPPPSAVAPVALPSKPAPAAPASVPVAPAPAVAPAAAIASKPSVAPAPATAETTRPAADIGAVLGQPGKTEWSPLEIVQGTSALPGIAGALIAMQDGLLVADHMPPELPAETFAAFLPQIFGRMSQYTQELKLGEPSHVSVVVAGRSLQVFKAGGVYFAVLSRVGECALPSRLEAIAAYLGGQTQ